MTTPNTALNAIAAKLNVLVSAIVRVESWAKVLFVVVRGLGGRFVSKGVLKMQKVTWTLTAAMRRQEGKKWVARITGKNQNPVLRQKFGFEFIEPASIEWGKTGMKKAVFELSAIGFYKDSDGDFFKVFVDANGELNADTCSYQEAAASI